MTSAMKKDERILCLRLLALLLLCAVGLVALPGARVLTGAANVRELVTQ